jgi:riboflavin kinase
MVDSGYGRGGKKLGVPTANLPASLFQNALEDVTPGVYFGWTALEDNDKDKNGLKVYKAVVNVGFSPTFEGQENPEKIIEAHLIVDDELDGGTNKETDAMDDNEVSSSIIPDFYGVPIRLQLIGFLREEKKFDSFPDLIAQIHADVKDAKMSLDFMPYRACLHDGFLSTSHLWIGKGGGDEKASWESTPIVAFLESLGLNNS